MVQERVALTGLKSRPDQTRPVQFRLSLLNVTHFPLKVLQAAIDSQPETIGASIPSVTGSKTNEKPLGEKTVAYS